MYLTRKLGVSFFLIAVIALSAAELWVVSSPSFPANSALFGPVVALDLIVGIPLLYYGLVMRPYRLSPLSLPPIVLLSFLLADYILPSANRSYLDLVWLLVPLLELAAIAVFAWKARQVYGRYRQARERDPYFIGALKTSISTTFGNNLAVTLLTLEFSLIFLSLFGWFMKFRPTNSEQRVYTYHRTSRYPMIFGAFLVLIIAETIGFHLLLERWSPLVAWIVTGVSIYSIFWMLGDFTSLRLHPIVLDGETLHLRSGLLWSADLPVSQIADIQTPKRADAKARDYLSFARAGEAKLVLVLDRPLEVSGVFGIKKQPRRIGMFVDNTRVFRAELDQRRSLRSD
jgi:hypothetical protein